MIAYFSAFENEMKFKLCIQMDLSVAVRCAVSANPLKRALGRSKLTSRAKSSQRSAKDSSVFFSDSSSSKVVCMAESGR
jgi:hypothetical protein